MAELPSESALWGWLTTGLGGAVAMVERMAASGVRPSENHLSELYKLVQRLGTAIDRASQATQESGKPSPATQPDHAPQTQQQAGGDTAGGPTEQRAGYSSDWPTGH